MQLWETFIIAVGLSMDALAVSVTQGFLLANHRRKWARVLLIAAFFGLFQAVMPLIGYFIGSTFAGAVDRFGAWIAFALLLFLGAKMIWDALRSKKEDAKSAQHAKVGELVVLAIATSIDAFAVGITYSLMKTENIWANVAVIGCVTAAISFVGAALALRIARAAAAKTGRDYTKIAAIVGGAVLIGIGIKILLESLL
ncbi:MAG: manganese efflux pump MntP family protein [Clostridiales bacterium]|nr:manganese efflux pump MntP family protein [Clostridiales bacterium]